jgi:MinD-like ATPase involved in chromosome partitioning or flagellar assembly/capsular polysaccharide biosynthesis protein
MTGQFETGLLEAAWRYRVMVLIIVCAATLASFGIAQRSSQDAVASATIGLRTPGSGNVIAPGVTGDASLGRYTSQRARFVTSDGVMSVVAQEVGTSDLAALRRRIHVEPSATSNIVTVTAQASSADEAVELASAAVSAYRTETARQVDSTTSSAIEAIRAELANLTADADSGSATRYQLQLQIAELQSSRASFGDGVEFVVEPTAESAVVPGLPIKELAAGVVVGLGLGFVLAWLRAERNRRVDRPEHAELLLDRPMLGRLHGNYRHVPKKAADRRLLPTADFRELWTTVSRNIDSGVVVVQSVGAASTSPAVVNLVMAACREDFNVLVVDAGVRAGTLSTMLGQPLGAEGLADVLRDRRDWRPHTVTIGVATGQRFTLLRSGSNVDEVDVSASQLEEYVGKWRSEYDFVLIDANAVTSGQLSSKLASAADQVLFLVAKGARESDLLAAAHHSAVHGAKVLGFAFVDDDRSIGKFVVNTVDPRKVAPSV